MSLFPDLERNFTFVVNGLRFGGTFPKPSDRTNISVRVAMRLGGVPVVSIPEHVYSSAMMAETLNYVISDRPEQFKKIDFAECEDEELVLQVFTEYVKRFNAFKESLKKNNDRGGNRETTPESRPANEPVPPARVQDIAERIQ